MLFARRKKGSFSDFICIVICSIQEISKNELFSYAISKTNFLNDLRDNANDKFVEVIKNQGIERIKIEFRNRLDDYNNRVKIYLQKAETEVKEYNKKFKARLPNPRFKAQQR